MAHMPGVESGRGAVHLILGPMFSGKSTELLRRVRRYTVAKKKCMVVKYNLDNRYSENSMSTHDKQMWVAVPTGKLDDLNEDELDSFDVIGIDEGQFFPNIVDWATRMASKHHKVILIAALDGTFQRKPFGRVLDLVPLAETVVKLNAVCMHCSSDAPFTARLSTETAVEVIGGADKYVSLCRLCFEKQAEEQKLPKITRHFPLKNAAQNRLAESNQPVLESV